MEASFFPARSLEFLGGLLVLRQLEIRHPLIYQKVTQTAFGYNGHTGLRILHGGGLEGWGESGEGERRITRGWELLRGDCREPGQRELIGP